MVPSSVLQPEGDVAIYGRLRGCNEILKQAIREDRTWWYIDRGYFKATRDADYSGFFRVTKNALQHSGMPSRRPVDMTRYRSMGLRTAPWRRSGKHILICPPGLVFGNLSGFDSDAWTRGILTTLRKHTDRPLRVREKPRGEQARNVALAQDLADCWALVTHSSNTAVETVMSGVPVFCTDPCAASTMGLADITKIETPVYPDNREEWAATLCNAQWTLDEMRKGLAWRMLNDA